jgi:hypothetical protein
MPLLKTGIVQPIEPSDFGTSCVARSGAGPDPAAVLGAVTDPTTSTTNLLLARLDPRLPIQNVAVPGAKVLDILNGSSGGTPRILEHFFQPLDSTPDALYKPIHVSEIAHVEMVDPDIGLATDLMANDIDGSVVQSDDLHLELITPLPQMTTELTTLAARLGALHGQHFLANLPALTFLPNVASLRASRLAAGTDTAASFDAKVQAIDLATDQFNDALTHAVAPYPNLHVVDFHYWVENAKGGLVVGGETLTTARFGGLLSLDFLHFTNTAYALLANVFLDQIGETLGITLPDVDVEAVHATDPLSPSKLLADGIPCAP